MVGAVTSIFFSLVTAIVGLFVIASAVEGYFTEPLSLVTRIVLAIGGLALVAPNILAGGIGFILVTIVLGAPIYKIIYSKYINPS